MFKLLLAVALLVTTCSASIEKEPVKVTHQNSGPRYELDDVGRISLAEGEASNNVDSGFPGQPPRPFKFRGEPYLGHPAPQEPIPPRAQSAPQPEQPHPPQQPQLPPSPPQPEDGDQTMGVSIRRVFLFPIMAPPSADGEPNHHPMMSPMDRDSGPNLLLRIMASHPPERHHHPHLLGQDEASRGPVRRGEVEGENPASMTASASGEGGDVISPIEPQFNPLQMMIDMMRHALSSAGDPMADQQPSPSNPFSTDLNRDASSRPEGDDGDKTAAEGGVTSLARPFKPESKNETKEEIVEIEGRKYLRKSIMTKHVGENMMFMSRRMIFVPLNETDAGDASTTTTAAPTLAAEGSDKEPKVVERVTKPEESSSTTTTTTTTTSTTTTAPSVTETTNTPTTSEPQPKIEASTTAPVEEATTTIASSATSSSAESATEKILDAAEDKKSSEKLTETTSTLPK